MSYEAPAHVYKVNHSVAIGELKLGRLLIGNRPLEALP